MVLENAARTAKEHMDDDNVVKDIVITVPSFYTQFERQGVIDTATIAGLRVLTLIDENTAAALHYGIDRSFIDGTQRVLFVNVGAKSTQMSLVDFNSKNVKKKGVRNITQNRLAVVSKAWDRHLGGEDITQRIIDKICNTFNEQLGDGEDVRENARAIARIRKQAKKVKEVLSANERIPFRIESLHKGKDLNMKLSRSDLETISADFFAALEQPIKDVLEGAGAKIEDIDAVELIGGGVRVPKVQETLRRLLNGKELGTHMNGDESMALGAVFRGANVSASFRVRHVGLQDITPVAVGVRLSELANASVGDDEKAFAKRAALFKRNTPFDAKKVVAFHHDKDFACTLHYKNEDGTAGENLVSYDINGVKEANTTHGHLGEPKVTLVFHLDASGISQLIKAEAIFTEEIEVVIPPKKKSKSKKDKKKKTKKNDDDEAATKTEPKSEAETEEGKENEDENVQEDKVEKDTKNDAEDKIEDGDATPDDVQDGKIDGDGASGKEAEEDGDGASEKKEEAEEEEKPKTVIKKRLTESSSQLRAQIQMSNENLWKGVKLRRLQKY